MGRVIAPSEAAVHGQLALHTIKDFLTNESRNLRHERPLLSRGIDASKGRMLTRDRSRTALQGSAAVPAVAIHLTAIRGVRQHGTHTGQIPPSQPVRGANTSGLQLPGQREETVVVLGIPGKHLADDDGLRPFDAPPGWIPRPFGVDAIAVRRPRPG